MKRHTITGITLLLLVLRAGSSSLSAPPPVLSGFTYQGYLKENNQPANGTYDFQFRLYDLAVGGVNLGGLFVEDVVVSEGRFSVTLNFAASLFDGNNRFLLVGVRPGSSVGTYTNLLPRQKIDPTPYALYAENASKFGGRYPSDYVETAGDIMTGPLTVEAPDAAIAVNATATTTGLSGSASSSDRNAAGIRGIATAGTGAPAGVEGLAGWHGAIGVRGLAASATPATRDLLGGYFRAGGEFYGPNGVIGLALPENSDGYGMMGVSPCPFGRGVFGDARTTTGTAYGVYGRAASPNSYAGYFVNENSSGVAIRAISSSGVAVHAAGSGIIRSSAKTEIMANPFNLVTFNPPSNITLSMNSNGYMTIASTAATNTFVYLPVQVPPLLYGNNLKIQSVDITYRVSNPASYITLTTVRIAKDGSSTDIISNSTDRTSTAWETYTLTDPTLDIIDGIVFVRFNVVFSAASHFIYLNKVKLTLLGD